MSGKLPNAFYDGYIIGWDPIGLFLGNHSGKEYPGYISQHYGNFITYPRRMLESILPRLPNEKFPEENVPRIERNLEERIVKHLGTLVGFGTNVCTAFIPQIITLIVYTPPLKQQNSY